MSSTSFHQQTFAAIFCIAACASSMAAPLEFKPIANLALAGSELCDYDPASQRLFVTADIGLQVVDLSDPATMKLQSSNDLDTWVDEAVVPNVEIGLSGGKRFFRFQAQENAP